MMPSTGIDPVGWSVVMSNAITVYGPVKLPLTSNTRFSEESGLTKDSAVSNGDWSVPTSVLETGSMTKPPLA